MRITCINSFTAHKFLGCIKWLVSYIGMSKNILQITTSMSDRATVKKSFTPPTPNYWDELIETYISEKN